jgi:hypothetical protein
MKKIVLAAAAMIALSTPVPAADFSGKWKGKGTVTNAEGLTPVCKSVLLTIAATPISLKTDSSFSCEGSSIAVPGGTFTIGGNELLYKSKTVGSMTDTEVSTTVKDGDFVVKTRAVLSGDVMNLTTVMSKRSKSSASVMTLKAALKR